MDEAARMAQRVFPAWASFSPFRNESESAAALYIAYLFRLGPESLERALISILEHEDAYRSNPQHFRVLANSTLQLRPINQDKEGQWVLDQVRDIDVAAGRLVDIQEDDLRARSADNSSLAEYIAEAKMDQTLLSLEMQYVWGIFSTLWSRANMETSDAIVAQLIYWLVQRHGMSFAEALAEARSVRDLEVKADSLFLALSKRGSRALEGVKEADYAIALHAIDTRFQTAITERS